MITLIYGGSGSGKSAFAEDYVCNMNCKDRFYLATMKSNDSEAKARIEKHRNLRSGKGFVTLEHDTDIVNAIKAIQEIDSGSFYTNASDNDSVILLECMSNLVANEMFRDGEIKAAEGCVHKILSDIKEIAGCVSSLVIVTNDIFDDGMAYDPGTKEYMRALGKINRKLAEMAQEVYEVVVGIGIKI
jgi:adenosylcobinamide kinase/adenosylcobinamide-phosphate guanylyltransferase